MLASSLISDKNEREKIEQYEIESLKKKKSVGLLLFSTIKEC
jgi:hypothetical protein